MGVDPVTLAQPFAPPTGTPLVDTATPTLPRRKPVARAAKPSLRTRLSSRRQRMNTDLRPARPPIPGSEFLRLAVSLLLGVLAVFTLGGGVLVLLLWQEERASGVLTNQVDRAWDLFENLRRIELIVAYAVVPLATVWAAVATLNVRRATARRRNPVIAALSIPAAVAGVWAIGAAVVAPADNWMTAAGGLVLQAIVVAVPVVVLERVARAAEGRRRPLRMTYFAAVAYLAILQGLGTLSTIVPTHDADRWAHIASYLIMAALVQIFGAIAVNESCRAIEVASTHRYSVRKAFSENVLLRAGG
ncbi:MAG TPA: hypothetical protein VFV63_03640 [Ilumatobacteraceae bacterium]|nr:hypothetical protein [Ilumatobacteraceae bacterium]